MGMGRSRVRRLAVAAAFVAAASGLSTAAPAAAATGRTAITAGVGHTCALNAAGGVECWGDNQLGQIGDGTLLNRWTPVGVTGLSSGVKAISAGGDHTCALTTAGGVRCWGSNESGQLGDGTTTDRPTPVNVVGLGSGVAAISAGIDHTCALTTNGAVKCWGANRSGQLGDGTTDDQPVPVDVTGLGSSVSAVSAGGSHTCALTAGRAMKCWGANYAGQLGDGTTTDRPAPVTVSGLGSGVAMISAGGSDATCALTTAGAAKCWGYNYTGAVGDGTTVNRLVPTNVKGLGNGVATISTGLYRACAITTAGALKCWGSNFSSQLGDGTTTNRLTPVNVTGLTSGVTSVTAGGRGHTCALAARGTPKCWGEGYLGQLGDDTLQNRSTPVNVVYTTIPVDSTPPVWTKLPTNAMNLGATLDPAILGDCDSYNMPVTVSWAASDPQSGIHHYAFGLEAGPYDGQAQTETSTVRTAWVDDAACGGGGNDQEFYAFNRAGLYSDDAYWPDSVLTVFQDDGTMEGWTDPIPMTYQGSWSTSACNCWSGGTTQWTRQSAASVQLAVPDSYGGAYGIGLLMAKGPDRGKAAVFVDNVKVATVDTYSATKSNRTVVWRQALAAGPHTVRVVNLATPGRPRIDVDAVVLMRK